MLVREVLQGLFVRGWTGPLFQVPAFAYGHEILGVEVPKSPPFNSVA
jgi:hypothetical protein